MDTERFFAPVLDRSATQLLADRLKATDPQEILYALGLLEMEGRPAVHPAVRGLLEHPSPAVRQQALASLSAAGDVTVRGTVEKLLRDPHLDVRTEAEIYDPDLKRWSGLPDLKTPRHGLGGVALRRRVYAIEGGPTPGFDFSNALEALDIVPARVAD